MAQIPPIFDDDEHVSNTSKTHYAGYSRIFTTCLLLQTMTTFFLCDAYF